MSVVNSEHFYFGLRNLKNLQKIIFQKLCGEESGCTKLESNIENAPSFHVKVRYNESRDKNANKDDDKKFEKEVDMEVKGKDYVHFDENGSCVLALKDLDADSRMNELCGGPDMDFCVGRLF